MHTITFDKQGHRGCRGLLPENTIPAMLRAIDLGVTTLEMDVVVTKDDQIIVSHEPYFHHEITTKPDGNFVTKTEELSLNIYRMTYEEVERYDVGSKPHPRFALQQKIKAIKPLLIDVIDQSEAYCLHKNIPLIQYNLEIKTQPDTDFIFHPAPEDVVNELMKIIYAKNVEDRVTLQSFDIRPLQYIHQHFPGQKTGLLIEHSDKKTMTEQINSLGFIPTFYNPHFSLVNEKVITECHQLGMKIIPWTVNTIKEIKELKDRGVDGVITDYPNLFDKLT